MRILVFYLECNSLIRKTVKSQIFICLAFPCNIICKCIVFRTNTKTEFRVFGAKKETY